MQLIYVMYNNVPHVKISNDVATSVLSPSTHLDPSLHLIMLQQPRNPTGAHSTRVQFIFTYLVYCTIADVFLFTSNFMHSYAPVDIRPTLNQLNVAALWMLTLGGRICHSPLSLSVLHCSICAITCSTPKTMKRFASWLMYLTFLLYKLVYLQDLCTFE